nr:MAG TPA: hypothetical protein [Caudoviricetes sp.]
MHKSNISYLLFLISILAKSCSCFLKTNKCVYSYFLNSNFSSSFKSTPFSYF